MFEYLESVLRHKWFVFIEAWKLGIPWLGFIHDASKFSPQEFLAYARYNFGDESLNDDGASLNFSLAWNAHQKRNKHHWQYYVLINDRSEPQITTLPMPERYTLEMIADWRGAGRAYGNPDTAGWYFGNRDKQIMHSDTRKRVEELLEING